MSGQCACSVGSDNLSRVGHSSILLYQATHLHSVSAAPDSLRLSTSRIPEQTEHVSCLCLADLCHWFQRGDRHFRSIRQGLSDYRHATPDGEDAVFLGKTGVQIEFVRAV